MTLKAIVFVGCARFVVLHMVGTAPWPGVEATDAEVTLRALESQRLAAMVRADGKTLEKILGDDLSYADASGVINTKASLLAQLSTGRIKYEEFTESDVRVRIYEKAAILTGQAFSRGLWADRQISQSLTFTAVYVLKQARGWQLVAWQATEVRAGDNVLSGRVGAPVRILLESTPGTGAIWYAPTAPPHTTIDSQDSIPAGASLGGRVQQVFVFRADTPGTYVLTFELKRAWETVVREERRVVIRISAALP